MYIVIYIKGYKMPYMYWYKNSLFRKIDLKSVVHSLLVLSKT